MIIVSQDGKRISQLKDVWIYVYKPKGCEATYQIMHDTASQTDGCGVSCFGEYTSENAVTDQMLALAQAIERREPMYKFDADYLAERAKT